MDDRLPEVLWAVLLAGALEREVYLELFRAVSDSAAMFRDTKVFVTHSEMAKISDDEFSKIAEPFISDENARKAITPLRMFKSLPDLANWVGRLPEPDPSSAWEQIAEAVSKCLFHQSETSTDIRWLKVRFLIIQHRLHIPENLEMKADEILEFPNRGDMRSVRPSIRAMERVTADTQLIAQSEWPANFWRECFESTPCLGRKITPPNDSFPHDQVNETWAKIYVALVQHCMGTITTTSIDERHEGAFGLALYGLTLLASLFRPHSTRPGGRIILRALVETYLTMAYLVKKDNATLWKTYRAYGGGQAKLAFLKLVDTKDLPRYVELETLETLANEDVWQEFLEIDLGHWANKDLRRMSEEVGVKQIYDKYYNWPSSFVHAQWPAVRNTVFDQCLNPLHRLHRIPRPPRLDLEDVSWDAIKLGNLMLDLVNEAYPPFKPRLRIPEAVTDKTSSNETGAAAG